MTAKFLTIIPVRLASTRLPNKPLADILGKSMIARVYEQAIKANLGKVVIACDGEEIAAEVKKFGGEYVITDPNLPSGTDRIYAAYEQLADKNFDAIINLQGDLPNIDPNVIRAAAESSLEEGCDFATVASKIKNKAEITNPNVVKIAISFENFTEKNLGRALYFSRCPIPYYKDLGTFLKSRCDELDTLICENRSAAYNDIREQRKRSKSDVDSHHSRDFEQVPDYFHHIGIYAYKKEALEKFVRLKPSTLEKRESLEQLRALENNMKIFVKIVDAHPLSVDTKEDLEVVTKVIADSL
ncbi:MAG: 3-deoxy-manno-octulosonate cytidylyltransferase [Rickettsiales bacterium]|nr:3-deoxy-manno-octulosonate cytidylyltransferase [Rickettsiales bacterium]